MSYRSSQKTYRLSFGGPLTPAVKVFLWINGLVYLSAALVGNRIAMGDQTYQSLLFSVLGLNPQRVLGDFALWQLMSYMFVHFSFTHLLFNALAIWWFGADLEAKWGTSTFIRYYLFCGAGAGFVSAVLDIPTIGASGAVFGLLFAFGASFPDRVMYIYFLLPIKAKYCAILFGAIELFSLVFSGGGGNINHAAHLSGIAFGWIWFVFSGRRWNLLQAWATYKRKQRRKKLKVIYPHDEFDEDQRKDQTIH